MALSANILIAERKKLRLRLLNVSVLRSERGKLGLWMLEHQCADVRERSSGYGQSVDYREREAQAKCLCADVRVRGAQAMATKHQSADYSEREVQAMATKRQSADYRAQAKAGREAQAKVAKRQCANVRERSSGYGYQWTTGREKLRVRLLNVSVLMSER